MPFQIVGIKGEFDVFNKHIGIWKVGPIRGKADVVQTGRNTREESCQNFCSIKSAIFYSRIVEFEGQRGTFENISKLTFSALAPCFQKNKNTP